MGLVRMPANTYNLLAQERQCQQRHAVVGRSYVAAMYCQLSEARLPALSALHCLT